MKMGSLGSGNHMLNNCSRCEEVDESMKKKLRKPLPCTLINVDDDDKDEDEAEAGACRNENESTSASTSKSSVNPVLSKQKVFREDKNGDRDNVLFIDEWNAKLSSDDPCLNEDQTEFRSSHDCRTINNNNSELNSAAGLSGNFKSMNKKNHQEYEIDIRACPSVHVEAEDVSEDMGEKQRPDDLLIDRQKIKETDLYKRAMEEESESRQRQLQIQAEEARRLRRRKKAETNIERRQKQRLEEMRETQKKDEENLCLKEQLRAECRNKLNLIEKSCKDMASLLRRLGVHVDGNIIPSLTEVQTAYKKAVLKFHPDRSSRTDIRQQVEAEETFKLISRMKEKYLP